MSAPSNLCGHLTGGIEVEDTFAEAFGMTAARLIVTADTLTWARVAGQTATGYATSVISCDAEAAIERELVPDQTPDGRPGVRLLMFAFSRDALEKALIKRVGQCVMTCPTTACYNDLPLDDRAIVVGGKLRYFGDGWQIAKLVGERRFWRVPTMDGEFACEERFGTLKGIAGGNLLFQGTTPAGTLEAAERAVAAIRDHCDDVILPFPGGIARSGSKVGSKYKALRASVNDAHAPTLRGLVASDLPESVQCVYELVIDGLSFDAVARAMQVGLTRPDFRGLGLVRVSAGNYGGKLGPHHFHLRDLLTKP